MRAINRGPVKGGVPANCAWPALGLDPVPLPRGGGRGCFRFPNYATALLLHPAPHRICNFAAVIVRPWGRMGLMGVTTVGHRQPAVQPHKDTQFEFVQRRSARQAGAEIKSYLTDSNS